MKKFRIIIIVILVAVALSNLTLKPISAEGDIIKDLNLTEEEIEFLKNHDTFYYAYTVDYAPIEYMDSEGNPKGFGVEYLRKASEILNIKFIPVEGAEEYTWQKSLDGLIKGEIDVLPAVTNTEQRRKYINFTDPYLKVNIIVIGNNDNQIILDEKDMEGATFVLPSKYWQNEYVESALEDYEIINTLNMLETFRLINEKKGKYTFVESVVYNYYSQFERFSNLRIVGELNIEANHCIGVSKGNELLRDILNKVIKYVPKDEVYKNAMIVDREDNNSYLVGFFITVVLLIIIIIFLSRKVIKHNRYKYQMRKNKQTLMENLSHDLKTPLSVLKVNIALLNNDILGENEKKKHLRILDNSIDSLDAIIEDLYDITHIKDSFIEKKFDSVNVCRFLKEIYDQHKDVFHKQDKTLKFLKDDVFTGIRVNIDKISMYRAISNLLSNALKFTKKHDEIILEYRVEGNRVVIYVKDNGQGIDRYSLEHIFDRFYQGNNKSKPSGKGLGLAITKEIIEMHQGKISVTSKKDRYTVFRITLPIGKVKEFNED